VVADSAYGDNLELERALVRANVPHVLAHRGAVGRCWAPADVAHSFAEAIEELPREAWVAVERRFRGGRTEAWWAAELTFAGYGPDQATRAVVATTDRDALPALSTWYLSTNLSRAEATLAEVVRLYGLRVWVEEGYKRVKGELGWADFQVRSDRAIRRHWALVCCAFSFCWAHEALGRPAPGPNGSGPEVPAVPAAPAPAPRGENRGVTRRHGHGARAPLLAGRAAARARLAGPVGVARALLARVGQHAPAAGAGSAPRRRSGRARAQPLRPDLTNHR
jgi:hypothetical protein